MTVEDLREQFGNIDIYLFDQLLRGRISPGMRILDAGCGSGRNIVFLLRAGYEVYGADPDAAAIHAVRRLAQTLAPRLPPGNFHHEPIERATFPEAFADVVISSAVLHFAEGDSQFDAMLRGTWRMVKPGGILFCRLASSIGIESQIHRIDGRVCLLPDGSQRYLVDESLLMSLTGELGGELLDPLKTTVVQSERAMTTWVVRRNRP